MVSGQLVPADGAAAVGLRVHLRAAAWADSVDADTLGRFSLSLPAALLPGDTVEVRADAATTPPSSASPRTPRRRSSAWCWSRGSGP